MKKANDIEMFDVDAQLDAAFGKEGVRLLRMPANVPISLKKNWRSV